MLVVNVSAADETPVQWGSPLRSALQRNAILATRRTQFPSEFAVALDSWEYCSHNVSCTRLSSTRVRRGRPPPGDQFPLPRNSYRRLVLDGLVRHYVCPSTDRLDADRHTSGSTPYYTSFWLSCQGANVDYHWILGTFLSMDTRRSMGRS